MAKNEENRKSIAEQTADTKVLISEISRADKGETLTYEWFAERTGRDPKQIQAILPTINKVLRRDHGMVLSNVRTIGYRILKDEQIVNGELPKDRKRRARAARKSKEKAGAVSLQNLAEIDRLKLIAEIASAHVVYEASTKKSQTKLIACLGREAEPLALNKALNALVDADNKK